MANKNEKMVTAFTCTQCIAKFKSIVYANLLVPPGKPFPQARHLPQAKPLPNSTPPTRHIYNNFNLYLFLDSEPWLGKSQELNNHGMKAQVKRAF